VTVYEKIKSRCTAIRRNRGRAAKGIVVDIETYQLLFDRADIAAIRRFEQADLDKGDTYLGLDVAVTQKPDTLVVY